MSEKGTSLVFTGDLGFDKYMAGKWTDEELLSKEIKEFLRSGDHLIVNVEGPLSDGKKNTSLDPAAAKLIHSMDPAVADFLVKNGADIWNICNNHIMDCGPKGLSRTLAAAAENNAKTLGAGMNIHDAATPVIINEAGGIGMIGVGYQRACRAAGPETPGCFSWSDIERIKEKIRKIKETCRWCIVVAHAGEEFTPLPSPYTRQRYLDYLEYGADIVIAHHPHVPMNYETVGNKIIFYSLGNFVFDTDYQRSQLNTEYGIIVKLHFTPEAFEYEPLGIRLDRGTGTIEESELPRIFEDVCPEEYEKLSSLSARAFIENTKKQFKYLYPAQYENATEEDWVADFYKPLRTGRVPGETLDFQIIYPLSLKEAEKTWKESKLEQVVGYILEQIPSL